MSSWKQTQGNSLSSEFLMQQLTPAPTHLWPKSSSGGASLTSLAGKCLSTSTCTCARLALPFALYLLCSTTRQFFPEEGLLFVDHKSSPLTREQFSRGVKSALSAAQIAHQCYSDHSFCIGAATADATAGVPAHVIKMLGRWSSKAYLLYIHTPKEALAATSQQKPL